MQNNIRSKMCLRNPPQNYCIAEKLHRVVSAARRRDCRFILMIINANTVHISHIAEEFHQSSIYFNNSLSHDFQMDNARVVDYQNVQIQSRKKCVL